MLATRAPLAPPRVADFLARHGIHYGWIVVGVLFLVLLISSGMRAVPSVLIRPLEGEFGWDRSAISFAVSINLVLFGALGPWAGRLIDRSGPRVVALVSTALVCVGGIGTTLITQVWQLDLWWGLVAGAGMGGLATVLVASVVNRWFVERRGLVTGIVTTAISTGQVMFVPLAMWLTTTIDWRAGLLVSVVLLLVLVLPSIVWLFRDDPRDVGLGAYGESTDAAQRAQQSALRAAATPMSVVVRTLDFWLLAGGFFVCGFTSGGLIGTHFIPHTTEHGIAEVTAAGLFGLMGALNFVGTIAGGMLADRVHHRRWLLAFYYGLRGVMLLLLPFLTDVTQLTVFAILYGLFWFATGSATQLLAADRFGHRSVGQVSGWIFLAHQLGSACAATWGGLAYDWFGSYQWAFILSGLAGLIAAGFSLQIREGRPAVVAHAAPAQ